MAKGLKLKISTFRGLINTFVENTGEKLVGEGRGFLLTPPYQPSVLNRVNHKSLKGSIHFITFYYYYKSIEKVHNTKSICNDIKS